MTQNVAARIDVKTKKSIFLKSSDIEHVDHLRIEDDIPEPLFRQMTTCQTAANEFLRQFWSSIYPPPAELQTVAVATPAQKATKAAKMIGYISKTHEKVDALVRTAQREGIDPARIEIVSVVSEHSCSMLLDTF